MDLAGAPLLQRVVERLQATREHFPVVVATTTEVGDDPIRDICAKAGLDCYSGHPTDLLDRHYRAAKERNADVVVKIPSDCPMIDPSVIDRVLDAYHHHEGPVDYVSNLHPATYPDGYDVEVVPMRVLEEAWAEADRPMEREHTTPFIWERPDRYKLLNVSLDNGQDFLDDASVYHRLSSRL